MNVEMLTWKERQDFLKDYGPSTLPFEVIHSTSFTDNEGQHCELYLDIIITVARKNQDDFPDMSLIDMVINMITGEYLTQACLREDALRGRRPTHHNPFIDKWIQIGDLEEMTESAMGFSVASKIRRKTGGPKLMQALGILRPAGV